MKVELVHRFGGALRFEESRARVRSPEKVARPPGPLSSIGASVTSN